MKRRTGREKQRRKGQKTHKTHTKSSRGGRRRARVPPPESELWPLWCRGKLWEPVVARWFAGRCQLCAYSCAPTEGRRFLDKMTGLPTFLVCTNHPDSPGHLRDVLPTETCRNFKAQYWQRPRVKHVRQPADSGASESDRRVRRIPLGHGLYATVDAADYKWLSKYKWCASRKSGKVYAMRRTKEGLVVYMHREIMRAPKGYIVDHIDHNTLNNRRCNLRVVKPKENYANVGPHGGISGYVGVYPRGATWEAGITWRGKHFYLGRYDDPVEAAKVRDRKAYELHGELAFLNFPEEIKRCRRRRATGRRRSRGIPGTPYSIHDGDK